MFNHNIETVPRLFPRLRPQGRYALSLELLAAAKQMRPAQVTKSGLMVGLGETRRRDRAGAARPACRRRRHRDDRPVPAAHARARPVQRYVAPEAFQAFERLALALGFPTVYSGVFVRSSFNAEEVYRAGGAR